MHVLVRHDEVVLISVRLRRVSSSNSLGHASAEYFDVNAVGQHLENIALRNGRLVDSSEVPFSQNVISEPQL